MPTYRFGKHPPKQDYRTLRFRNYVTASLAAPPASHDVLPREIPAAPHRKPTVTRLLPPVNALPKRTRVK
jgi:hypothetical protein